MGLPIIWTAVSKAKLIATRWANWLLNNPTIQDSSDETKQVGFDLSGATTGTSATHSYSNSGSITETYPDSSCSLVIERGTNVTYVYDDFLSWTAGQATNAKISANGWLQ